MAAKTAAFPLSIKVDPMRDALLGMKTIGGIILLSAVASAAAGAPAGVLYSNLTTPSDDDLEDVQTRALTRETRALTKRLRELPPRPAPSRGSDIAWRRGSL